MNERKRPWRALVAGTAALVAGAVLAVPAMAGSAHREQAEPWPLWPSS